MMLALHILSTWIEGKDVIIAVNIYKVCKLFAGYPPLNVLYVMYLPMDLRMRMLVPLTAGILASAVVMWNLHAVIRPFI